MSEPGLVKAEPLSADKALEILRRLGLVIGRRYVLAVEQLNRDMYRVIFAKEGTILQVYLTKHNGEWRRTFLQPLVMKQ